MMIFATSASRLLLAVFKRVQVHHEPRWSDHQACELQLRPPLVLISPGTLSLRSESAAVRRGSLVTIFNSFKLLAGLAEVFVGQGEREPLLRIVRAEIAT